MLPADDVAVAVKLVLPPVLLFDAVDSAAFDASPSSEDAIEGEMGA